MVENIEGICNPDLSRNALIKRWANAPFEVNRATRSTMISLVGHQDLLLDYIGQELIPGENLRILGEPVMNIREWPWCKANVDNIFHDLDPKIKSPNSFFRGAGLLLEATYTILQKYLGDENNPGFGSGEIHIAELNHEGFELLTNWKNKIDKILSKSFLPALSFEARLKNTMKSIQGSDFRDVDVQVEILRKLNESVSSSEIKEKPKIKIFLYEGDAVEISEKMADEGKKFDVISSDMYPLKPEEKGFNDIGDLYTIMRLMKETSRFGFFGYFPGSTGGLIKNQRDVIADFFGGYKVDEVSMLDLKNTGNDSYYQDTYNLPVVTCWKPKFYTKLK